MQVGVQLAEQVRVEEPALLVVAPVLLVDLGVLEVNTVDGLDLGIGLVDADLEDVAVDRHLGTTDLLEQNLREDEAVHHVELGVNGVEPVTEVQLAHVIRELPHIHLFLIHFWIALLGLGLVAKQAASTIRG